MATLQLSGPFSCRTKAPDFMRTDSYFRWLYTAVTRTKQRLFAYGIPKFGPAN